MRMLHAATMLAFAVLAACASGPTVRTNMDQSANLSAYSNYTFAADPGTNRSGYSTPITSYFKEAIRREMDARGYQFVESGEADLMINFNANARENVDVRSAPAPTYGYYGYRGGLYRGAVIVGAGAPELDTVRYKVGTANVDVVDARKKQLVWEGIAEGKLTEKMMRDPRAAISSVITEMFTQFPGRAGAESG